MLAYFKYEEASTTAFPFPRISWTGHFSQQMALLLVCHRHCLRSRNRSRRCFLHLQTNDPRILCDVPEHVGLENMNYKRSSQSDVSFADVGLGDESN